MALPNAKQEYRSRAVARAFQVLGVLGKSPGVTVTELSRVTGIPTSTLLGILGSLIDCSAVRTDGRHYELGVTMLQLGQAYSDDLDLVGLFNPVALRLRAALDETVQLGVLSGSDAVYIARQESTQPVRLVALVGRTLPAYASAVGKAHLAWMDEAERRELLGPEPFAASTADTITTYDELERDLHAAHRRRFAESRGECIPGLHCISAPILESGHKVVAAISVSTPQFRMDAARRRLVARSVQQAADELSGALGSVDRAPYEQLHTSGRVRSAA